MITAIHMIQRSIAFHGILGTTKLAVAVVLRNVLWFMRRRDRAVAQKCDLEFDRKWGVDTRGTIVPAKSEVTGPNWIYGVKYQGCDASALAEVLGDLNLQYEDFAFIDLGSGKGRAILVASRFPFRRIVGVEYSEQLCQIARHNVTLFPKAEIKCNEIDIICDDAVRHRIPEGPLVIFLYNPFGRQVMKQVVQNVLTSYQQDSRRIIVIYFTALFAELWKNAGFMEEIRASKWIAIYDTKVRKAPASG